MLGILLSFVLRSMHSLFSKSFQKILKRVDHTSGIALYTGSNRMGVSLPEDEGRYILQNVVLLLMFYSFKTF
jgi:hypothetical protein